MADRKTEYPFYPELSEEGAKEAQQLIEKFKADITKVAEDTITQLYCEIIPYLESDSWGNFRNEIMSGFRNYNNKAKAQYDFKEIRQQIYKEFRSEIIPDLNQDLVEENETLKKQLEHMSDLLQIANRGY